jgi:IMP dehydrogenase/GMP reductase
MVLEEKFDFNDIVIIPSKKTHINSRYDDISLPKNYPLFTAPMDTVVDLSNIDVFLENNINVVLPRTVKYEDLRKLYDKNPQKYQTVFTSFGFNDLDYHLTRNLIKDKSKSFHENAHILIDIANGHMQKIVDYCTEIKRLRPDIVIMVGNIANPETYEWYVKNECVNYIRLGIGGGQSCLSAKQTGVYMPLGSLVYEINEIKKRLIGENPDLVLPKIIVDGGIKDYSDIIKSIGLGSDYVMIGSIFNKAIESCAPNYIWKFRINIKIARFLFKKGFTIKKHYRGMSTKAVQKALGKTIIKTSEGVHRVRNVEYTLNGWVENFNHYLRSAMSYCNCKTLDNFIGKVNFCKITKNSYDRFNK